MPPVRMAAKQLDGISASWINRQALGNKKNHRHSAQIWSSGSLHAVTTLASTASAGDGAAYHMILLLPNLASTVLKDSVLSAFSPQLSCNAEIPQ
jgi:hypothetical protein